MLSKTENKACNTSKNQHSLQQIKKKQTQILRGIQLINKLSQNTGQKGNYGQSMYAKLAKQHYKHKYSNWSSKKWTNQLIKAIILL